MPIFLPLLLLAGCLYDDVKKIDLPKDPPNVAGSEYFPNTVGNYLEYSVLQGTSYRFTVTIKIVGIQKLVNGKDASIWQYRQSYPDSPDFIDTVYVWSENDTIKTINKRRVNLQGGLAYPDEIYPIPFQNGQQWNGKHLWTETYSVTRPPDENVKYVIGHHYLGPNMEYTDTLYFRPYIGFTKINLLHYVNAPAVPRKWELKKYYLK